MMTKNLLMGNIRGQLVQLAFPLLLGNVLQQLYNAADSIIIGRFVGSTAFAAVGVAGTVRNLFVFMISGVCVGYPFFLPSYTARRIWTVTGGRFFWH